MNTTYSLFVFVYVCMYGCIRVPVRPYEKKIGVLKLGRNVTTCLRRREENERPFQ